MAYPAWNGETSLSNTSDYEKWCAAKPSYKPRTAVEITPPWITTAAGMEETITYEKFGAGGWTAIEAPDAFGGLIKSKPAYDLVKMIEVLRKQVIEPVATIEVDDYLIDVALKPSEELEKLFFKLWGIAELQGSYNASDWYQLGGMLNISMV